jgi:hypothetical protein
VLGGHDIAVTALIPYAAEEAMSVQFQLGFSARLAEHCAEIFPSKIADRKS